MTNEARSAELPRGAAIQERLDRLGISDREFHESTGIDRKTLRRAVNGEERVRPSTFVAIEHELDRLEQERGLNSRGVVNGYNASEFAAWLIDARGRAGMTQRELSSASGVHINTIKKLEAGETRRPSAQVAARLRGTLPRVAAAASPSYDKHTQAGLDLIGAYLMRMPEEQRLERILDLTRHLIEGQE